jgi:hypothetical protein
MSRARLNGRGKGRRLLSGEFVEAALLSAEFVRRARQLAWQLTMTLLSASSCFAIRDVCIFLREETKGARTPIIGKDENSANLLVARWRRWRGVAAHAGADLER